jgi:hypothetical protein
MTRTFPRSGNKGEEFVFLSSVSDGELLVHSGASPTAAREAESV